MKFPVFGRTYRNYIGIAGKFSARSGKGNKSDEEIRFIVEQQFRSHCTRRVDRVETPSVICKAVIVPAYRETRSR